MDASIRTSKKYEEFKLVSTTDFFYPSIKDPYIQGRIGACNVLSDMYAMGIYTIDSVLMILSVSIEMEAKAADIVTRNLIRGFNDCCKEAGCQVSGGQTVKNPWPIIGDVAQSICKDIDIIYPINAVTGDVIILTKPLGTQVAVNMYQWLKQYELLTNDEEKKQHKYHSLIDIISKKDCYYAFDVAVASMARLSNIAAQLMHKYDAHAATDITGFGLIGHAENLATNQIHQVDFTIHTLPLIKHTLAVDTKRGGGFRLKKGYSKETSGGLFISLPANQARLYINELKQLEPNYPAYIIGNVQKGSGQVTIIDQPTIIEI